MNFLIRINHSLEFEEIFGDGSMAGWDGWFYMEAFVRGAFIPACRGVEEGGEGDISSLSVLVDDSAVFLVLPLNIFSFDFGAF